MNEIEILKREIVIAFLSGNEAVFLILSRILEGKLYQEEEFPSGWFNLD